MAKFRFVQWLLDWLKTTKHFRFEWDSGNTFKSSAKHSVSPEETEQVIRNGKAQPLGVQVSPSHSEERLGVVGPTDPGRMLQVVFTLRGGRVRPISARPAKRKERKLYEAYLREIS